MENPKIKLFERIHKIKKSYQFNSKLIENTIDRATPFQRHLLEIQQSNQNHHRALSDKKKLEIPILVKSLGKNPKLALDYSPGASEKQPYFFSQEEAKCVKGKQLTNVALLRDVNVEPVDLEYIKEHKQGDNHGSSVICPLEENAKSSLFSAHPVNFLPGKECAGFKRMVRRLKPFKDKIRLARSYSNEKRGMEVDKLGLIDKIILQKKGENNTYQVKGFGLARVEGQRVLLKTYEEEKDFYNGINQSARSRNKTDYNDTNIFGFNPREPGGEKFARWLSPGCRSATQGDSKQARANDYPYSDAGPSQSSQGRVKSTPRNINSTQGEQMSDAYKTNDEGYIGNADDINLFEYNIRPITVTNSPNRNVLERRKHETLESSKIRRRVRSDGNAQLLKITDEEDRKIMLGKSIEKRMFVRSRELLKESLMSMLRKSNQIK